MTSCSKSRPNTSLQIVTSRPRVKCIINSYPVNMKHGTLKKVDSRHVYIHAKCVCSWILNDVISSSFLCPRCILVFYNFLPYSSINF